jgi:hypothetical protein
MAIRLLPNRSVRRSAASRPWISQALLGEFRIRRRGRYEEDSGFVVDPGGGDSGARALVTNDHDHARGNEFGRRGNGLIARTIVIGCDDLDPLTENAPFRIEIGNGQLRTLLRLGSAPGHGSSQRGRDADQDLGASWICGGDRQATGSNKQESAERPHRRGLQHDGFMEQKSLSRLWHQEQGRTAPLFQSMAGQPSSRRQSADWERRRVSAPRAGHRVSRDAGLHARHVGPAGSPDAYSAASSRSIWANTSRACLKAELAAGTPQ